MSDSEVYDLRTCREQLERDLREAIRVEAESGDRLFGQIMANGFLKQSLVNAIRAAGGPDLNELVSEQLGVPGWRPPDV
jgi:hypothetical protein